MEKLQGFGPHAERPGLFRPAFGKIKNAEGNAFMRQQAGEHQARRSSAGDYDIRGVAIWFCHRHLLTSLDKLPPQQVAVQITTRIAALPAKGD
jgi:hypothetical protein